MKRKRGYIIGLDEVGRGALAGPVMVGAVLLPSKFQPTLRLAPGLSRVPLKDSKKLTPKQRESWFRYTKNHPQINYAVAGVSPKIIDRLNISKAANLAAGRALKKLLNQTGIIFGNEVKIILDRGLCINKFQIPLRLTSPPLIRVRAKGLVSHSASSSWPRGQSRGQGLTANIKLKSMIKADEKINAVKLASIAAKVTRDRLMIRLHQKFPEYGFDRHKGYGTGTHRQMIGKYGKSEVHRETFYKICT